MRSEKAERGAQTAISAAADSLFPPSEVSATTFIPFSWAAFTARKIFSELPLVLMASKVSPAFPTPST